MSFLQDRAGEDYCRRCGHHTPDGAVCPTCRARCPVCHGNGTVRKYVGHSWAQSHLRDVRCDHCQGTGQVPATGEAA